MNIVSVNAYTKAVVKQLRNHPLTQGIDISRSEEINTLPNRCPWIGVYRSGVQYPVRVLGNQGGSRYQYVDLILVCQQVNYNSGAECEDAMEQMIADVIAALWDNQSLKDNDQAPGLCDVLDKLEVMYTKYVKEQNAYMQTAMIYVTALSRTN